MEQNISRKEFDVLTTLAEATCSLSQRDIGNMLNMPVSTVNRIMKELCSKKYIEDSILTDLGIDLLNNFTAKKAIFLAAGFGSRLIPITLNIPKPLIRVNGERIIDSLIDAVLKIGINDITIVRGYLGEQFDQLLYKYPMIKFLENPVYNETNNISSIMCGRYCLENAYVLESDFLIMNGNVLKKYHYCSDYLCSYKKRTDDWCFEVKGNVIIDEKIGGINCYQMKGISYWNSQDGKRLSNHLKEAYDMPGGKELYWEQVPIIKYHDEYHVEICECKDNDIIEIDTFAELKKIDKAYDL